MYLQATFTAAAGKQMIFPLQYNQYVQSAIYNLISPELADFLHNKGFQLDKRSFKMFCFSRINGPFKIDKEKQQIFYMDNQAKISITSPEQQFIKELANSILLKKGFHIGGQQVTVQQVDVGNYQNIQDEVLVNSLSPVTVYSTLSKGDGSKYTCYFQPGEKEFAQLVESNLRKKFQAYYQMEPPQEPFAVKPIGKTKQTIIQFKGTIIKGYSGKFRLQGPSSMLRLALAAGLGSKNSQGFGYLQQIN